jgi:hypothetical protein
MGGNGPVWRKKPGHVTKRRLGMNMDEGPDRPTISANTRLAALAVDVGGMVEAAISVLANLGQQIETRSPQLDNSDRQEPSGRPRPPIADMDGCRMAMGLREAYMLAGTGAHLA